MTGWPSASSLGPVQSVAFVVPLLPGQTHPHRLALASCQDGARREAFRDARRRAGIVREVVWIQSTPDGDVAVVYLEADDLATAFTILATASGPFDRWYRDHVRQVHGIAVDHVFEVPELVLDFDSSGIWPP